MPSDLELARCLAQLAAAQGGRCYFVGGYVRDALLGRENKDIDIEVHGVAPDALRALLAQLDTPVEIGASFGIFGLRGHHLDIALPRTEASVGRGHRDFDVHVDPFLGARRAAMRRDFTVNAMMQDVLTGEILDFFGGQRDMRLRVIRHVDADSFVEDPLRALRAAQFAARFGYTVAEPTVRLCAGLALDALARERVMGELEKALLKAERPSAFFQVLRGMGQLSVWFPELEALIGLPQNPEYHPEGDAFTHTLLVLDEAAALHGQAAQPLAFMLSALAHDLGKALTTRMEGGKLRAIGHDTRGLSAVRSFLARLTAERELTAYVLNMARLHMRPNSLLAQHAGQKAWNRLLDSAVCPGDLLLLAQADHLGRGQAGSYTTQAEEARRRLAAYDALMAQPHVAGRDLIEAGLRPDRRFGELLAYAHALRLAGVPKEPALRQTLALAARLERTSPSDRS